MKVEAGFLIAAASASGLVMLPVRGAGARTGGFSGSPPADIRGGLRDRLDRLPVGAVRAGVAALAFLAAAGELAGAAAGPGDRERQKAAAAAVGAET